MASQVHNKAETCVQYIRAARQIAIFVLDLSVELQSAGVVIGSFVFIHAPRLEFEARQGSCLKTSSHRNRYAPTSYYCFLTSLQSV